ncbi:hypothetical protein Tco_1304355 [Tanacetum coccineum]
MKSRGFQQRFDEDFEHFTPESLEVAVLKDMVMLYSDKKNQSPAPTPVNSRLREKSAQLTSNQGKTTWFIGPISNQIRLRFSPVKTIICKIIGNIRILHHKRGKNFNQAPAYQPPVQQGQIYRPQVVQPPAYQAPAYQAPVPQTHGVSKTDFDSYVKANDAVMRNMQNQNQVLQTQGQNMQTQLNNLATSNQRLESMLGNFIKMNTASTSGTLPSNTVTNPKEDLKGITTRSGVAYKGPTIHTTSSPNRS